MKLKQSVRGAFGAAKKGGKAFVIMLIMGAGISALPGCGKPAKAACNETDEGVCCRSLKDGKPVTVNFDAGTSGGNYRITVRDVGGSVEYCYSSSGLH